MEEFIDKEYITDIYIDKFKLLSKNMEVFIKFYFICIRLLRLIIKC